MRVREFYEMKAEDAYNILETIAVLSGTKDNLVKYKPTQDEKADEAVAKQVEEAHKQKLAEFKFSKTPIPIGATITYIKDKNITATVIDDKHIEYNGDTTSLSGLAKKLLGVDHCAGPQYFTWQNPDTGEVRTVGHWRDDIR